MTSNNMGMGWGYPYSQWPQSLKDEYAYNPTQAKQLLADAGFPTGFKTNVVADASGDMDLLQIVKSSFAAIGIDMEIRTMPSSDWATFVQSNHKQDQLTMRGSGYLGMTFDVDRQMQRFVTGANWSVLSDPTCDSMYAQTLAATSVDAYQKIFNQFNLYVAQQHFMISIVTPTTFFFYQPWYKGFMAQDNSVSGN
jgi:peptide/nickel transport system substrate-binding protein